MDVVTQWLWRLLPGNPMVVRIVESGSRRTRHLWVRMGYLGALILLVLIGLLSGAGVGGETSLTELAKSGTWVFAIVAYGQVILVCLLAPLFMAAAIGQERAGETLAILLTTPLTNLQIVLGSLAGRLFFVLALLLSGLPLFSVLLIFGGVPISSVFIAFAVAGLTAIMVGSVAVALSVFRAGGRKAVFSFVITIAAYLVGAYLLDVGLLRNLPGHPSDQTTWLTPLHPLLVLESSLTSANYRPPRAETLAHLPWLVRFYLGQPLAAFAILTTLTSTVLILASSLLLRRIGQGESAAVRWLKRKLRVGPAESGTERRRPPREVGHNPIAWREANTRGKIASGIVARWAFVGIGLFLGLLLLLLYHVGALPQVQGAFAASLPPHEVFHYSLTALLLIEVAVIALVAIYMSAGCVSREREDGTLDLVLTTPVTPRFYIWGKLQGLVRFLSLLIAVPVLTLAMVSVYGIVGGVLLWPQARATYAVNTYQGMASRSGDILLPEAPLLLAIVLVPFIAFCVASGMNFSLKARGVLGAVIPTVATIGAIAMVLGLCGLGMTGVPILGPIINAFSPATSLLVIINPWERVQNFADAPGFQRVWLFIAALIAAGGYSLLVWSLITGMVKNFDQTVRRLSGTG